MGGRPCFRLSHGLILAILWPVCRLQAVIANGVTTAGQDLVPVTAADTGLTQYVPAASIARLQQNSVATDQASTAATGPRKHYNLPPIPAGATEGPVSNEVQPLYSSQAVAAKQQNPGDEVVVEVPRNTTGITADDTLGNNTVLAINATSNSPNGMSLNATRAAAVTASSPTPSPAAAAQSAAALTASPSPRNVTGSAAASGSNATAAVVTATNSSDDINSTTGPESSVAANAVTQRSSNSTANETANSAQQNSTDDASDDDSLPTVIEPVYGSTSSNMTQTPIPVQRPIAVPPITPAAVPTANTATGAKPVTGNGQQTAVQGAGSGVSSNTARSSNTNLQTTVVTVRAPSKTPVTVKVQPGGPNTAVDVTVDDPDNTLQTKSNMSGSGHTAAPVTVKVQPPNAVVNSTVNQKTTTGVTAQQSAVTTLGPGSRPVYSNNSNPLTPPRPGAASSAMSSIQSQPQTWLFKQAGAKSTITVGCILPFEGPQQVVGEASMTALHMAMVDWAPKLLPTTNINLTCLNGKCQDIAAYWAMTRLARDNVVAVVGEVCSGASLAAAGVATAKHIPMISPASTSASLSQKDYFFRTVPSDRHQGVALAKLMYQDGARAVGLVYEDSTYGYGLAFNFIAAFTTAGGTVPSIYKFAKGTPGDPRAAAQQLLAAKRNQTNEINAVVVVTNNLDFVAGFLKASKAANLDLPIYGGDSEASPALFDKVQGSQSDIQMLVATVPSPGTDAFKQAFAKYSNKQAYSPHAAHAYDAMVVLLRSLAAAKSRDGPSITAEMAKQSFQGVSGPTIQFDEFGDLVAGQRAYAWIKFDPTDGEPVTQGYIDARRRQYQLLL